MNFLAHCLLGYLPQRKPGMPAFVEDPWRDGLLAGAILGDFVKGPVPETLPPALIAGIRLHRRIDSYSNRLAEMKASFRHFHPALRRPAPVLLDLVADHCLALDWRRYAGADKATAELPVFAGRVCAALERMAAWTPPPAKRFVRHLVETDLLPRYGEARVIHRAMAHVLARLGYEDHVDQLAAVLDGDLPRFQDDFRRYFPLLREFAAMEREELLRGVGDRHPAGGYRTTLR